MTRLSRAHEEQIATAVLHGVGFMDATVMKPSQRKWYEKMFPCQQNSLGLNLLVAPLLPITIPIFGTVIVAGLMLAVVTGGHKGITFD